MSSSAPVSYIDAITKRYASLGYDPYRWYHADSEPAWQGLSKPLSRSRLGVLSTSGAYVAGQVAYHYKDDTSVREIPKGTSDEERETVLDRVMFLFRYIQGKDVFRRFTSSAWHVACCWARRRRWMQKWQ